jgi:hypothetical protein
VSDEHWQPAVAVDPPQPKEHRAKQQQDRQRAHRPSSEWLRKDFRDALADREERSGRNEEREAHPPQMARQARPAARQAESHDARVADRRQESDGAENNREPAGGNVDW